MRNSLLLRFLPALLLLGLAAEIASIIWIGQVFGVIATLGLLLAAGLAGIALLRSAGLGLVNGLNNRAQMASLPAKLGEETLARFASGLVPGFLSDLLAGLLLVPSLRRRLWEALATRVKAPINHGPGFGPIIDAEAVEIATRVEQLQPPMDRTG
jgi:UPF0716 protein FxsA